MNELYDLFLLCLTGLSFAPLAFFSSCSACCTCTIFNDDFFSDSRSNYDLTGSWTHTGGSNGDISTSDNGARAIHTSALSDGRGRVEAVIRGTAGKTARIIGAWSDADNYAFLEVTHNAANDTLKLYERIAGVETQIGVTKICSTGSAGVDRTFFLCWDGTYIRAGNLVNTPLFWEECTLTGTRAGVGADASGGTFYLENIKLEKHKIDGSSCPTCQPCTTCDEGTAKRTAQVVIAGVNNGTCGSCNVLNGTFLLSADSFQAASTVSCSWELRGIARPCAAGVSNSVMLYQVRSTDNELTISWNNNPFSPSIGWRNSESGVRDCSIAEVFDFDDTPYLDGGGASTSCAFAGGDATVTMI